VIKIDAYDSDNELDISDADEGDPDYEQQLEGQQEEQYQNMLNYTTKEIMDQYATIRDGVSDFEKVKLTAA
jgi:hypothetical protein